MFSHSKHKAFLWSCSILTLTGFLCAAEAGEVTGCSSFLAGTGLDWKSRGSLSEQTHGSGEVSTQSTRAAEKTWWFWRGSTGKSLNQRLLLSGLIFVTPFAYLEKAIAFVLGHTAIFNHWSCPGSSHWCLEVSLNTAEWDSDRTYNQKITTLGQWKVSKPMRNYKQFRESSTNCWDRGENGYEWEWWKNQS